MAISPSELAAVRSKLSLPLLRHAARSMAGAHPSYTTQRGFEFDRIAPYEAGQDVSGIDWAATARAGAPMAKRFLAESTAPLIFVADTGRQMSAGAPSGEPKSDIVIEAVQILAYLATSRADPIGIITGDRGREQFYPPRTGNLQAEVIVRALRNAYSLSAPDQDLGVRLARLDVVTRRPSLVVLLTDLVHAGTLYEQLRRMRVRHSIYAFLVDDIDPGGLTDDEVSDLGTGALDAALLGQPRLARQARAYSAQLRARSASMLQSLRVPYTVAGSSESIVTSLADLFGGPNARG